MSLVLQLLTWFMAYSPHPLRRAYSSMVMPSSARISGSRLPSSTGMAKAGRPSFPFFLGHSSNSR